MCGEVDKNFRERKDMSIHTPQHFLVCVCLDRWMDRQKIEIDRYIDRYKILRKLKISWFLLGREAEWFGDRERELLFTVYSPIAFFCTECLCYLFNLFFLRRYVKRKASNFLSSYKVCSSAGLLSA